MKSLFLFGWLFALQPAAQAADTAYSALRVFGKREGEKALYRVVELRGREGTPQPTVWKLVVSEPQARGGLREIEVKNGRIVGERTPIGRELGAPMNFSQLNLDSDGVFTIVNQEAGKRRVTFDRLDYSLRSGKQGAAPLWEIELSEGGAKMGLMRIAADTGEILEQNFIAPRHGADDHTYLQDPQGPPPRPPQTREESTPAEREIGNFLNRVGRHFQKRGRQLDNFFTGRGGEERQEER